MTTKTTTIRFSHKEKCMVISALIFFVDFINLVRNPEFANIMLKIYPGITDSDFVTDNESAFSDEIDNLNKTLKMTNNELIATITTLRIMLMSGHKIPATDANETIIFTSVSWYEIAVNTCLETIPTELLDTPIYDDFRNRINLANVVCQRLSAKASEHLHP